MTAKINELVPFSDSLKFALFYLLRLRQDTPIGAKDFFAAMYVGAHEQFIRFFLDLDALENFFDRTCGLKDPVWAYWIRLYQKGTEFEPPATNKLIAYDAAVNSILAKARSLARAKHSGAPSMKLVHILLAAYDSQEIPFCRDLMSCGFDKALAENLL